MKNEIFINDELQQILDDKAANSHITISAFITDILMNVFKDELNHVPTKSYSQLYSELRTAVIDYKNKLVAGTKFTLHNVPYYKELSIVNPVGSEIIPAGTRARLGRSIRDDIVKSDSPDFEDFERVYTKNGNPAFCKTNNSNAAIYIKK